MWHNFCYTSQQVEQLVAHSDFRKWYSLEEDWHVICIHVLKLPHTIGLLLALNLFTLFLIFRLLLLPLSMGILPIITCDLL